MSETTAIQAYENGAQWVIRHNVIDGQFNGVASYLSNTDRSNYYGFDIHDNTFMNMSDDALEPEGAAQNWRMWNNEIHDVFNGFSTDSSHGPYYVFRNTIWMAGAHGMSDDGHPTNPQLKGFGSMFKYGTKQVPSARWFIINNSFWTDYPKANGFVDNVNGNRQESFWLRNNLVRVPHYPLRIGGANIGGWDEDYNFFASEVTADAVFGGFKYRNVSYNLGAVTGDYSLADYRVDSGVGAHSNHAGGNDYNFVNSGDSLSGLAKLDGFLNSPTTGILTLASGSHAIDSGVVVPNIADRSGVDYNGNAPDLGAFESAGSGGSDTTAPSTPTNLSSPSKTDISVDLTWNASTDNVGVTGYDVYNNGAKSNIVNITGTSYTVTNLSPNAAYTFTVKAKDAAGNLSAASSVLQVTTQNSNPSDPDLVGYWKFNETSGITAEDSSGSNNGTVINGAVWDSGGQIGGSLNFDGSNDYVSLPNIINPSAATFTASAWIYPDVSTGIRSVLVQEGTNGRKWLYREDGLLTSFLFSSKLQSTGSIVTGQWNHIAVTYDGTTLKLYLNGQQDGSATGTIESELGGMRVGIAKDDSSGWDGKIDDVRIYDRALSSTEIASLHGGDTIAPDAPTNLSSPSKTDTTVALSWTASTDNVGVTGYDVFNGGVKANTANISGTSYTVTNLSPNTAYTFTVKAKDAAGNVSAASSGLQVTTQNSNPPDPDLVGHWTFDEMSGTTASDSSGSNHGTVMNGAVWDAGGQIGGALNFDGSNDYVSLPNIINPSTTAFTASAWIYSDVSTGIRSVLVQEGSNGKKWLYREDGLLTTFLLGTKLQSTGLIVNGQWNHIAVTYDGTTITLYLNGQSDGATTIGTIESETGGMRIGIAKDGSTMFDGKIDDLRIYDTALSESAITALYNDGL
jgi:chitodextrinase